MCVRRGGGWKQGSKAGSLAEGGGRKGQEAQFNEGLGAGKCRESKRSVPGPEKTRSDLCSLNLGRPRKKQTQTWWGGGRNEPKPRSPNPKTSRTLQASLPPRPNSQLPEPSTASRVVLDIPGGHGWDLERLSLARVPKRRKEKGATSRFQAFHLAFWVWAFESSVVLLDRPPGWVSRRLLAASDCLSGVA